MADIALRSVTKSYDGRARAVDAVDLDIADGELLVLVGPSGCGKSTLLRMIAGLEEVTGGTIAIGGRDVTTRQPKDRDVAMVFQSYALYPHMTVARNIGYPLRLAKLPRDQVARQVADVAELLQLTEVLDRRPSQLSGGQRQRVAMGRALIRHPRAFLMDEPLSNLDAKLRVEMRAEIARLQRDLAVTTVYVTHDQTEAMTMGTRVAVLKDGRLQQVDTPQRLYDDPVNVFVAGFIGSPAMNLFAATVEPGDGGPVTLRLGAQRLALDAPAEAAHPSVRQLAGERVVVGIRPEALRDAAVDRAPGHGAIAATVDLVESLGAELIVHLSVTEPARSGGEPTETWRQVEARKGRAVARLDPRRRPALGEVVTLAVDPASLHLFDARTGASLRREAASDPGPSGAPVAARVPAAAAVAAPDAGEAAVPTEAAAPTEAVSDVSEAAVAAEPTHAGETADAAGPTEAADV